MGFELALTAALGAMVCLPARCDHNRLCYILSFCSLAKTRPGRLKGGVMATQGLENVSQNKASGSGFTDTNRARWAFTRVASKSTSGVFDPIAIDEVCIPVVSKAKLLGLTISNNLLWNDHVSKTIKNANKCYFVLPCPP